MRSTGSGIVMTRDAVVRTWEASARPAAWSRLRCRAALCAVVGSLLLATPALAGPVEDAYAAYEAGEFTKARDIARGAVAADESVNSVVARKVLVLAFQELGELKEAEAELERFGQLELNEADRDWLTTQKAAVAERLAALSAPPEPAPEAEPEQEPAAEPAPTAETEPAPTADSDAEEQEHTKSAVFLALGGGFQQVSAWSYAAFGGEVGFALIGPLWFSVDAQVSLSPNADCAGGAADDEGCTAVFTTIRPGPVFRFDGKVEAHVHAGFVLGINGPHESYLPVMPGLEIGGGVEFGKGPIAVRPRAAFRLFGPVVQGGPPNPGFLVGVDAVVRLGKR